MKWNSDQCQEIEENRMGKTRDFFKKIRDNKELFHAKTGHPLDKTLNFRLSRRPRHSASWISLVINVSQTFAL